ncbi:thiamine pyrophosphate-dependent enzyme [Varunaivibrio sulfuroxidans]|uniref:3D-(3,5/4)-trihydroxycyclohexane-1,2-dione acylhydrolase (Decyclizing) n=1 Tax=Varunaivibrio sulfuroxidans TaxID=1773489 RepID=A0A4R3JAS2_9PROT|nr:thiamine pyrophosphate-dependent enzyme [Varunaivibrio sulfuroxidans]TCS63099.1 3D-(3,5/4)-trihydroxycyclohexane-1,2-dione acylhydrolase (decyclizing) [Varunaivibrio sulfuroxidans]WES31829.1 thiamine pyrophosphate-dependent enzyme [Varunaivibrio sulfuroxidans]
MDTQNSSSSLQDKTAAMRARARAILRAGGVNQAIRDGSLTRLFQCTLSEALVLGLLKQGVRKYLAIFGHGSTDLGEVLRVYEEEGVTKTYNFRNEVAMAHGATALSWQYGEIPAVITSIGPGALQAMSGSLAAASNGVGVYHIYGDETTHGEGYNMQQIPKPEQGLYGRLTALMGESYVLHTPEALRDALRRGTQRVHHPYKAGPFYLLLPLNTQPREMVLNLERMPQRLSLEAGAPSGERPYLKALGMLRAHRRIVIKAGGGTRPFADAVRRLAHAVGAAVVLSPGALGVLPDGDPRNMHVGGSKGSISGNFAMREADLVIMIGSRGVCQADCSGIGYDKAEAVININADVNDVAHYNRTMALCGDIGAVIDRLLEVTERSGGLELDDKRPWLEACAEQKARWTAFKKERYASPLLSDDAFDAPVLSQPAAIKIVADFAKSIDAVKYFDAGDVQANGFQIVEDDDPLQTITETGASYMGFAVSALAAGGIAETPRYAIAFTGDGSFMMNPQILIDAVRHGVRAMVVIFDNRRMAAISGLQWAQYDHDFRTDDGIAVDYARMASSVEGVAAFTVDGAGGGDAEAEAETLKSALARAHAHDGLSVVHVRVYGGRDERGGMGAYGSWNVGNWVDDVQRHYLERGL